MREMKVQQKSEGVVVAGHINLQAKRKIHALVTYEGFSQGEQEKIVEVWRKVELKMKSSGDADPMAAVDDLMTDVAFVHGTLKTELPKVAG